MVTTIVFANTINVPEEYSTIQGAVDISVDGDTILVNNGTYYENIYVAKNLTFLTVEGTDNTIINGNGSNGLEIELGNPGSIDGFTFINCSNGLAITQSGTYHINNCKFSNNARGISSSRNTEITISNTLFENNLEYGFIQGYYGFDCLIVNCTFDNVTDIHFGPGYGTTVGLDIYNSIFTGQINGADLNPVNLHYSNYTDGNLGNNANDIEGNLTDDPLFVDSTNGNYNLQTTSPCINAGDPIAFSNDTDGSRNDMGYTGGSGIIIERSSIPFGYVSSNSVEEIQVKLTNYSNNSVTINSFSTDDNQFNISTNLPVTISAGENIDISFSYEPNVSGASIGNITAYVTGLYGGASAVFNVSGYGILYSEGIIQVPEVAPTIQSAVDISVDGDTILVNNGTYYENIYVAKNLTFLTVEGTDNTIINGNGSNGLEIELGNPGSIDGFTFINCSNGLAITQSGTYHINNCKFSNNARGISSSRNTEITISNTLFENNLEYGFIQGYYGFDCLIVNCTFDNVTDIHFGPGYGTTVGLDIYNSIFTGQINGADLNPVNLHYSNYTDGNLGNNANDIEGNLTDDPLFVDSTNGNYNLQTTSPCINAGDPDLDEDGFTWITDGDDQDPDDTRMDIGAYYLHHTAFSFPEVVLLTGDTTLIPLSLDFSPDSSYSSAAITITGYQDQIEFLGIETENSLTGNAGWTYQSNESDSLGIVWTAGSNEISESGVFCYFKFYVPNTSSSGDVPLTIVTAYLDEDLNYPTIINSGDISIFEIAYGDVSLNGAISPFDASIILKYLTDMDTLNDHQMLNANVSLDESISALDASLILQYGVGIIESLPYDTTMGSLLAFGDIGMEDGIFTPGEIVEVPVYLSNGDNILSFETEISYDAAALTFFDIVWSEDLGEFTIESNLTDGNLLFAGAGSLPDGQNNVFATLQFTINETFIGTETTVSMNQIRFNENAVIVNGASATLTQVLTVDKNVNPDIFALHQNYPNPFNPTTTLRYDLPKDAKVSIMIYDLMGRQVKTLINTQQNAGFKSVIWDAKNNLGQPVSAGMYLYRISAGDFHSVKKMVLLK